MKYKVTHTTEFIYEARVGLCYNEARLKPKTLPDQRVLSSSWKIDPQPYDFYERLDYFGNNTAYFSIQQPHDKLIVTVNSFVETSEVFVPNDGGQIAWEKARDTILLGRSPELIEASQFVLDSPRVKISKMLSEYARSSFPAGRPLLAAVHDLMRRIFEEFTYDPEFSTISTPLKDVMKHRSGVCQDFAHLAIGCLRSMGLPARYVSGYIETEPPKGKERLVGADASHAWFSVYTPDVGWLDFDPTNNQMPSERHIKVAWGRDFSDVTPLKGVAFGSGEHELKVAVDVLPLN